MKIMRLSSGLGNAMLQYAAYLQLKKHFPNEQVFVDTIFYKFTGFPFELDKVFSIDIESIDFYRFFCRETSSDISEKLKALDFWTQRNTTYTQFGVDHPILAGLSFDELPAIYKEHYPDLRIISKQTLSIEQMMRSVNAEREDTGLRQKSRDLLENKLLRKHAVLFNSIRSICVKDRRARFLDQITHFRKPDFCLIMDRERLFEDGDVYLNLYGNPCDCEGIRNELLEAFAFPSLDPGNEALKELILKSNSVAIHARTRHFQYGMGTILDRDYYIKAARYIRKKSGEPLAFFVFSDDPAWCRRNIEKLGLSENDKVCFVEGNAGADSYKDMQLMSYCKYHIIPNSTFSWWAGWLSQREGKMMVTPYGTLPGTISF